MPSYIGGAIMPSMKCNLKGCAEVLRRCKVCLVLYCPEHDKKNCREHSFSMPSNHIGDIES